MRLVLAARRSELARIQAFQVGRTLQNAHPQISIEYSFHESLGDKNQNDPLWQMPEKGVFTQDLREGLLAGRYDLAVHSWKDLAIEDDGETEIAATLPRADMRDLMLVRRDRWEEVRRTGRMTILTSSPRRSYNLDSFLRTVLPTQIKELIFEPVRGNVPTRVRKMWNPGADGLIVAKAALDRLLEAPEEEFAATRAELRSALSQCLWMVLPLRANPCAPAQGALAVEIKSSRPELRERLAAINCAETFATTQREREILRGYGGGCHQKIGASVLRRPYGEITFLRGLTDDGTVLNDCRLAASRPRPAKVTRDLLWPLNPSDSDWFKREPIPATIPDSPLWIAKADALPEDVSISDSQLVWASGLKTWERLAKRGVWVSGCAEGLGEQENPQVETIAGTEVRWTKLTHADAPAENGMQALTTYRLIPKDGGPNIEGKHYFFWTSGSGFERALQLHPWMKSMTHFCGPGNTQLGIQKHGIEPHVFLDHEQWLKEMS
ncbi:MAG TPA: hydroxymethylbilane synthase [Pyrinomonadaceae bacterium]